MKNILFIFGLFFFGLALGIFPIAQAQQDALQKNAAQKTALTLNSTNFSSGGFIPERFTCEDANATPTLTWQGAPEGTKSFALIVEDPDATTGTWTHWVVYNIAADTKAIPPLPADAKQGRTSAHKNNYSGPCPPRGTGVHRYFFRLYALDAMLDQPEASAGNAELRQAMQGHILAQAELMGRYGH